MSPQEKTEFERMKMELRTLKEVLDVPFIESVKRRAVTPGVENTIESLGLNRALRRDSAGGTSGMGKVVDEAGTSSFTVADSYDGSIIVTSLDGANYKLGYYNV